MSHPVVGEPICYLNASSDSGTYTLMNFQTRRLIFIIIHPQLYVSNLHYVLRHNAY